MEKAKDSGMKTIDARWWLAWPLVIVASYLLAQLVVIAGVLIAQAAGVDVAEVLGGTMATLALQLGTTAIILAIAVGLVFALRQRITMTEIGLTSLLRWRDIGLAVPGFIAYIIGSALVLAGLAAAKLVDVTVKQDLGVDSLVGPELLAGFVVFVVAVPILEEVVFRGVLYGKLRTARMPWWAAAIVVSVLFGAAHIPWGADMSLASMPLNVAVDTFCLSMMACGLRELTKSLWAPILLHMIKNGLAFYLLFVITLPNIPGMQ